METIALRQFDPLYIVLDVAFLLLLAGILIWQKEYAALTVGGLAGVLYFLVDFGIFHLLCHARSISEGHSLFWVLLWMSLSYGFTNFVWMWLWVGKNRHLFEYSFLILLWWFCCPLLTKTFGGRAAPIVIQRTTSSYHGYMAILLFLGYLFLILWNMRHREKAQKIPILWLLTIGILVQFGWEACLLLGGVRSAGLDLSGTFRTLIINSLLETNLGMPYLYFIYLAFAARRKENLQKRETPLSLMEALEENNRRSVRH